MLAHLKTPSNPSRDAAWLGVRCMSPKGLAPAIG
jgi:hypothetical protein